MITSGSYATSSRTRLTIKSILYAAGPPVYKPGRDTENRGFLINVFHVIMLSKTLKKAEGFTRAFFRYNKGAVYGPPQFQWHPATRF
jgi:hypothetical protein